jgi:PAS domain S-box-containing protein
MKIFHKILGITLPIVLLALFMGSWITYYMSGKALNLVAERWLGTRLNEAASIVIRHKEFLKLYGITNIKSGTRKAQFDAIRELKSIQIGDHGYIYLLDQTGRIIFHPDPKQIGSDISHLEWFKQIIQNPGGSINYQWMGEKHLGMFSSFEPWGWIVVATDPLNEIYGTMNNAKNYLIILAVVGSIGISLLIIALTRRLVIPLQLLVNGTQRVGRGDLDINIPVKSSDEIGHLSKAFNIMSRNLKKSLGALKQSEQYFRSLTENSSDLIALLTPNGIISYLSPSITILLGFSAKSLKGKALTDIMDKPSRLKFNFFLSSLHHNKAEILSREFVFLNQKGEPRIFEISGRDLTAVPEVEGIVVNSRDITARKNIEDELKTSELRLHRLSARLISAQEDERKRLSVELHDEVGQSLAVMKLKIIFLEEGLDPGDVRGKKECEDMVAYIDQVIENVRRLSKDLTPSTIEDLGLSAALMWLIDTIKKHYIITADINLESLDDQLPLDSQIIVYRIFQEAIANVLKHSNATRLTITGHQQKNQLFFSIEDNGKGFETKHVQSDRPENNGMGLPAMQERARMLGGTFTIKSRLNSGTILQFTVPIDKRGPHEQISHHLG